MQMKSIALFAVLAGTASAFGQAFSEVENNNSRTQADAQGIVTLSPSANGVTTFSGVTGTTTGTTTTDGALTSYDFFHLRVAASSPGIYMNRLVLTTTGTAGHTGAIMGFGQSTGVINTTSTAVQSSSTSTTPARFNQWYTFGAGADVYYRVGGTSSTTAPYQASYTQQAVLPITGPATLASGNISISSAGSTYDTDMWVYDSNFNAIAGFGNDDSSVNTSLTTSDLTRSFAPGIYYLAISRYNLANDQASPADDDFRSGSVLDFPGSVLGTSTTATAAAFTVTFNDGSAVPAVVTGTTSGAYDVQFIQFTVVPTPGAAAMLGLGGLAALRRRR
jgi:hypothetical protein